MFGMFKCPDCSNEWASASAWDGYTQECKECGAETEAYDLRPLRPKKHGGQKGTPHRQDLCEKCEELGYDCSKMPERFKELMYN